MFLPAIKIHKIPIVDIFSLPLVKNKTAVIIYKVL